VGSVHKFKDAKDAEFRTTQLCSMNPFHGARTKPINVQNNVRSSISTDDLTRYKYPALLKKARPDFKGVFGSSDQNWTFVQDDASPKNARATNE
jgi:hypothetical protein